jgi:hypothetical protein
VTDQPSERKRDAEGNFAAGNQEGRRNKPGQAPLPRRSYDEPPTPTWTNRSAKPRIRATTALTNGKRKRASRAELVERRREIARKRILGVPVEQIAKEFGISTTMVVKDEHAYYDDEADRFDKPAQVIRIRARLEQLYTLGLAEFANYNADKIARLRQSNNPGLLDAALAERADYRASLLPRLTSILMAEWRAVVSVVTQKMAAQEVPYPGQNLERIDAVIGRLDPIQQEELARNIRAVYETIDLPGP